MAHPVVVLPLFHISHIKEKVIETYNREIIDIKCLRYTNKFNAYDDDA